MRTRTLTLAAVLATLIGPATAQKKAPGPDRRAQAILRQIESQKK